MTAKPCPAGNCDAQLYSVAEFVFCPKCRMKNPRYGRLIVERKLAK